MYGLVDASDFPEKLNIIPVLTMKTVIASVKKIKRDDRVGYSGTFRADKDMTIAVIPVGYYEGVDRRLSNRGAVQVGPNNVVCPIVGNVSMNMTTIDVSHIVGVKEGEEVTVFSNNPSDPNSIISLAKKCGAIPYELVVHIPAVLRRKVVE
jgi:alanine racemase